MVLQEDNMDIPVGKVDIDIMEAMWALVTTVAKWVTYVGIAI